MKPCHGIHLALGPIFHHQTYSYSGVRCRKVRVDLVGINIDGSILLLSGYKCRIQPAELALETRLKDSCLPWFFSLSYLYVLFLFWQVRIIPSTFIKLPLTVLKKLCLQWYTSTLQVPKQNFIKKTSSRLFPQRAPRHAALGSYWAAPFFGLQRVSLTGMFTLPPEHLK